MQNYITDITQIVQKVLLDENPLTVLEISGYDDRYGKLTTDCQNQALSASDPACSTKIDRVDLSDENPSFTGNTYDCVYGTEYLNRIEHMSDYDIILIFHLFENMVDVDAKALLTSLLKKVKKQILVITPEYPYDLSTDSELSKVRTYHPVFFLGLDFSYELVETTDGIMQVYSVFPYLDYEELPCDILNESQNESQKLRIAYILPHQNLTGGMKAMLQQMKELTINGHLVYAYYRCDVSKKAIPPWSHLTDDDVFAQTVIPGKAHYLDHIIDMDIIVLAWKDQVLEFSNSKIPVVLWEQGSKEIHGDYKSLQNSMSVEHLYLHRVYRTPIHLLAVSTTIKTILKDVYNRESQLFPNAIDTAFYYPPKNKNNEIPVVLLVGNPLLEFKGFAIALTVIDAAHNAGLVFKVWWASQSEFPPVIGSQVIETFIMPTQEKLAELYRNADIFLSTSLYESFSLPPMEAMASGTAVIATDNGGINTYAKPGVNCLICEQGDFGSIFFALQYLLLNPEVRESLAAEGRKTALEYSFKNVVPMLEQCLLRIIGSYKNSGRRI